MICLTETVPDDRRSENERDEKQKYFHEIICFSSRIFVFAQKTLLCINRQITGRNEVIFSGNTRLNSRFYTVHPYNPDTRSRHRVCLRRNGPCTKG